MQLYRDFRSQETDMQRLLLEGPVRIQALGTELQLEKGRQRGGWGYRPGGALQAFRLC